VRKVLRERLSQFLVRFRLLTIYLSLLLQAMAI
jgi:hypothetical protein